MKSRCDRRPCAPVATSLRQTNSTHHIRDTYPATCRLCDHSSDKRKRFLFSSSSEFISRKGAKKSAKAQRKCFLCAFASSFVPLRETAFTADLSHSQSGGRARRDRRVRRSGVAA